MKQNKEVTFKRFPLCPLKEVTPSDLRRIKIGRSFTDLARLGLIGEYDMVEATPRCPRLYYRFDYIRGDYEIYAIDKDLIGYNLLHNGADGHRLNRLEAQVDAIQTIIEDPTEAPTETPTEEPTEEPTEGEKYVHSIIDRSADGIGGNLQKIIDGGILILGGIIKWYSADRKLLVPGNYVGVTITPINWMLDEYKDSLVVEYRGKVFHYDAFKDGAITFYVSVRCPGQEVPITLFWDNGNFVERFTVAITQESELEEEKKQ